MITYFGMFFSTIMVAACLQLCFLQGVQPLQWEADKCKYNNRTQTVSCQGRKSIPKLPKNAKTLIIKNGNLGNITKEKMRNVYESSIISLRLYNCNITFISSNAFENLKRIIYLDLSRNSNTGLSPDIVASSLNGLSGSNIRRLYLNWMGFKQLPKHMFDGLQSTNITVISLNNNLLRYIQGHLYSKLKSLRQLYLGWNGIISDYNNTFKGLSQITNLSLPGSWFTFFPKFCNEKNESVMPNLEVLDLSYPKIQSLSSPIRCLNNLQSLNLNGISLRLLYNNTFAYLPSLRELSLRQLGPQLHQISHFAFKSSSLQKLIFSVTGDFAFTSNKKKRFLPNELFNSTRNLTSLDLSYNKFQLKDIFWRQMFKPLKKLRELKLREVNMDKLPIKLLGIFPVLERLDLSSNKITNWVDHTPFLAFKALKWLRLTGNRIAIINESSFPEQWLKGYGPLKTLLLNKNPFSCTCDLTWFREWMDRTNISTDKNEWRCTISKTRVLDYYPWKNFPCLIQYIVPSLVSLFFILAIAFVVYVFRFRIKLWIYRFKFKRNGYQLISKRPCRYDSFIAYTYADLYFVQNQLIPKMEDEYNRQLCIRDRDFELGTVFSNHIVENIEASRTVILLLSSNFAKDNWCKFQLDVANYLKIKYGYPRIVPILLENIKFKLMNETIFQMMTNREIFIWSEDDAAQELFWQAMQDKIPVGDNEYASLNSSVQRYDAL